MTLNKVKNFWKTGLIVLMSSFFLYGCGETTEAEVIGLVLPEANYKFASSSEWQVQYPREWSMLTEKDVKNRYEESLEIAFLSNFKDLFFTPVITIEKVKSSTDWNSENFAEAVLSRNRNSLLEFQLLEKQTVSTVIKGEATITSLARFQGKEFLADDTLEYLQMYLTKNGVGYIITGAYDPTDNNAEVDKIINSLRTFKLK